MRVQADDRNVVLSVVVLMATQIVFVISEQWLLKGVLWLWQFGRKSERQQWPIFAYARYLSYHRHLNDLIFRIVASHLFSGVY